MDYSHPDGCEFVPGEVLDLAHPNDAADSEGSGDTWEENGQAGHASRHDEIADQFQLWVAHSACR